MPSTIATSPRFKFFDANGNPAAYYLLNTYAAGSLTPKTTWKNQDQSTANTNPITLDSNGECILWLDDAQEYKFVLTTPLGTVISTDDNISGALVGFTQDFPGAVYVSIQSKLRDYVSAKDFDLAGDKSDETTKLQNALNAAAGKVLFLEAGKTYGYTDLTIKAGTTIISNGATFTRLAASTTHGIKIESGVSIDSLVITTPGGAGGDKAVAVRGNNIAINRLSIIAAAQGVYNSTNYAVEIESLPSGTQLSNITINNFYCKYFSAGMFIKNVDQMHVDGALVDYFRTAIYLRDVSRSEFSNVNCRYTASTSYGGPGENGLLVESTLFSSSCFDLRFNGWSVIGAGEHGYRLGGQFAIRDVWFDNCRSWGSGSSIVVNNPAATEWHGGCGFKVLGATTVAGEKHKNIFFNNCHVEDINETFGSFPTGHGAGNFAGFQIAVASNVHVTGCSVRKRNNANYSCGYGAEIIASDHVYFDDVAFEHMYQIVRLYENDSVGSYPGWDLPCEHIYFDGCLISSDNPGLGYLFGIGDSGQNFNHKQIHLKNCHLAGAAHAVRLNTITGTGSYSDIYLDFTYTNCTANPAAATEPVIYGAASNALVNVRAPWHGSAYSPDVKNGSIWQDTYGGQILERSDGVWRKGRKTYKVAIADDSFTTIVPPADLDPGFLMLSGGGISKHMMAWYRATSSPASSKYAGAATTAIVNTALTGTTGTDGNITVGIQEDLIYIENRGGSSDTFIVTFL